MGVIPVYSPAVLLPSRIYSDITRDRTVLDVVDLDGERCGGITISGTVAIPAQTFSGSYLCYQVCPNNTEANQSSTGLVSLSRSVFAAVPLNNPADVMTISITFSRTKSGANRTYTSTCSFQSGLSSQSYSGTWADTTTIITWFRLRAFDYATLNLDGNDVFLENLPVSGLSSYGWDTLGNP